MKKYHRSVNKNLLKSLIYFNGLNFEEIGKLCDPPVSKAAISIRRGTLTASKTSWPSSPASGTGKGRNVRENKVEESPADVHHTDTKERAIHAARPAPKRDEYRPASFHVLVTLSGLPVYRPEKNRQSNGERGVNHDRLQSHVPERLNPHPGTLRRNKPGDQGHPGAPPAVRDGPGKENDKAGR